MISPQATVERYRRIAELTRQGMTARQIAEALGCTMRTVCRARARTGVSRPAAPLYPDEVWVMAESLLKDGASLMEVARTIGCDHRTVTKRFPGYLWDRTKVAQMATLSRLTRRVLGDGR